MSRVLIVEDEAMIAMLLEDMVTELGYEVAGCAHRVEDAVSVALEGDFDLAIIDINLNGAHSFPVARALRDRKIPFAFSTGYGASGLNQEFRDTPVLVKPFNIAQLTRTLDILKNS